MIINPQLCELFGIGIVIISIIITMIMIIIIGMRVTMISLRSVSPSSHIPNQTFLSNLSST